MTQKWTKTERETAGIEALQMRMRGMSFAEVAEQLQCSKSTAHAIYREALDAMRPHEKFELFRSRQLAELASLRETAMRSLDQVEDEGTVDLTKLERLCSTVTGLHKREASLCGLDRFDPAKETQKSSLGLDERIRGLLSEMDELDIGLI